MQYNPRLQLSTKEYDPLLPPDIKGPKIELLSVLAFKRIVLPHGGPEIP